MTVPGRSELLGARDRALAFAERQGIATYDPYDYKGAPTVMALHRMGSPGKLLLKLVYASVFVAPFATRRLLGVRKQASAGGVAHLVSAYLAMGEVDKARTLLPWLVEHRAKTEVGAGWGLPFGWQSGVATVPAETAIGHTTMAVGNAFLSAYRACEDGEMLAWAVKACDWLTHGLHQSKVGDGIALSYTPLDDSRCVNSNADIASLLVRVGVASGREDFIQVGAKIARFVVEAQNSDGSWNYLAGKTSGPGSIIDGYHTAMTLTGLQQVAWSLYDESAAEAYRRGLAFYLDRLFAPEGRPVFATTMEWPVDIYACAQGMVTLADGANDPNLPSDLRARSAETALRLAAFTVAKMQSRDGSFLYRRYPMGVMRLGSLRWAQALTILGLTRVADLTK